MKSFLIALVVVMAGHTNAQCSISDAAVQICLSPHWVSQVQVYLNNIFSGGIPAAILDATCQNLTGLDSCLSAANCPAAAYAFNSYICGDGKANYVKSETCVTQNAQTIHRTGAACIGAVTMPPGNPSSDTICKESQMESKCYYSAIQTSCGSDAAKYVLPYTQQVVTSYLPPGYQCTISNASISGVSTIAVLCLAMLATLLESHE